MMTISSPDPSSGLSADAQPSSAAHAASWKYSRRLQERRLSEAKRVKAQQKERVNSSRWSESLLAGFSRQARDAPERSASAEAGTGQSFRDASTRTPSLRRVSNGTCPKPHSLVRMKRSRGKASAQVRCVSRSRPSSRSRRSAGRPRRGRGRLRSPKDPRPA